MKTKIISVMVLIVLFTIFVSQNTPIIPVNIFFWQAEMSVIVLISLCTLIGVIIGFIFATIIKSPAKEKKQNVNPGPYV